MRPNSPARARSWAATSATPTAGCLWTRPESGLTTVMPSARYRYLQCATASSEIFAMGRRQPSGPLPVLVPWSSGMWAGCFGGGRRVPFDRMRYCPATSRVWDGHGARTVSNGMTVEAGRVRPS